MSRSGYTDDMDDMDDVLQLGRWRAQVASVIRGKKGQAFLREAIAALDALPEKKLAAGSFIRHDAEGQPTGEFCTLGAVGRARGIDMTDLEEAAQDDDGETTYAAERAFGVRHQLMAEIMWMNDEAGVGTYEETGDPAKPRRYVPETPEQRWLRMRRWLERQLIA